MTSHIIMWNKDSNPSDVDLDNARKLVPSTYFFMGKRTFDIPERGEVNALLFSLPAKFDPDDLFNCTWTNPVIHDLDYPE